MAPRMDTTPPSNVSSEVIAGYAIEYDRAQREKDEAVGRARAILKRAKSAGVKTKLLIAALAQKKQDPDELRIEMRDSIRYCNIIVPLAKLTQADLFNDAERPLNSKTQAQMQTWEAEQKGYDCGLIGGTMDDAVFAPGTPAYAAFQTGFTRGQTVIAERMGENSKQADSGLKKRRGKKAAAADDSEQEAGSDSLYVQ